MTVANTAENGTAVAEKRLDQRESTSGPLEQVLGEHSWQSSLSEFHKLDEHVIEELSAAMEPAFLGDLAELQSAVQIIEKNLRGHSNAEEAQLCTRALAELPDHFKEVYALAKHSLTNLLSEEQYKEIMLFETDQLRVITILLDRIEALEVDKVVLDQSLKQIQRCFDNLEEVWQRLPIKIQSCDPHFVREEDVLCFADRTRAFVSWHFQGENSLVLLSPDGEITQEQGTLEDHLRSGEVIHIERGKMGLYEGICCALYAPYRHPSFLKAGDTLRYSTDSTHFGKYMTSRVHSEVVKPYDSVSGTIEVISILSNIGRGSGLHKNQEPAYEVVPGNKLVSSTGRKAFYTEKRPINGLSIDQMMGHTNELLSYERSCIYGEQKTDSQPERIHPTVAVISGLLDSVQKKAADRALSWASKLLELEPDITPNDFRPLSESIDAANDKLGTIYDYVDALGYCLKALSDYSILANPEGVKAPVNSHNYHATVNQDEFKFQEFKEISCLVDSLTTEAARALQGVEKTTEELAAEFFTIQEILIHIQEVLIEIDRLGSTVTDKLLPGLAQSYQLPQTGKFKTVLADVSASDGDGLAQSLKTLAETICWSPTEKGALGNPAAFHYDPVQFVERLLRMPGIEVLPLSIGSSAADGPLAGAILWFPPSSLPDEIKPLAETVGGSKNFFQLLMIHPDYRGTCAGSILKLGTLFHSHRVGAQGYFGTIPEGHLASIGRQLSDGAVVSHNLIWGAHRFDGTPLPKRLFVGPASPRALQLLHQLRGNAGTPRKGGRMDLLKQVAAKTAEENE